MKKFSLYITLFRAVLASVAPLSQFPQKHLLLAHHQINPWNANLSGVWQMHANNCSSNALMMMMMPVMSSAAMAHMRKTIQIQWKNVMTAMMERC